ncbi:MAG: HlyD family efflux transporter periplasmic adaptor subunit [Anaerolineae bacterium]|nr:HlyD family efflux transporter periplasmic adaptor subunit [Anaerolineae bacterium]
MKHTSNTVRSIHILFWALLLIAGCNKSPQGTSMAEAVHPQGLDATPAALAQSGSVIKALGTIRPAQTLPLSFAVGGPVEAVPARLGVAVKTGSLLAGLDTTALQLELENAQAQVTIEQAALDALLNGPSQAEIDRAEAAHAQQVAQAEMALRVAQLQLEQAKWSGPTADVAFAQAGQAQLNLQLAQARANSPLAQVTIAQVELARATRALEAAQDEYKKALDRPWEPQQMRDGLVRVVQQAQWEVQIAQARLEAAQGAQRAHALGLDLLAAQGETIGVQLAQALDARAAYTVTLTLLAAQVEHAQADLDTLRAWVDPLLDPPAPEAVAQARSRLRQAELAVEQVRWRMAGTEIRAPFDGVISAVHVRTGEWAAAGAPAVEILDTTRWLVETRNVSELNIGRISAGQEARVQILALGNQAVRGQVEAISPVAVVQQGDTTYTLLIALEPTDLDLRPGMNAQVEIDAFR